MSSSDHPQTTTATSFWNDTGKTGIASWIFSTDHKRIGLLYFYSVLGFFLIAVVLGLLMKIELMAPGRTIMGPQTYNAIFTVHGVIMIFLFIIPGFPGAFGNLVMPIQIGARDVAFPRLNLFSWWLYMIGAAIILTSLFTGGGPPDTGWTFYVPFSARTGTNVSLAVLGVFIIGFSSILTGDSRNVRRLTDAAGYRFERKGEDFIHPVASFVVAGNGTIVRYLYGTTFLPKDLALALLEAREGKVGITIRKVVGYCFSFDPLRKTYVFNLLRVCATVVLLSAGTFLAFLLVTGKRRKQRSSAR